MITFSNRNKFAFALLFASFSSAFAQTSSQRIVLDWKKAVPVEVAIGKSIAAPYFDGAVFEQSFLPSYTLKIKKSKGSVVNARLSDEVYEEVKLSAELLLKIGNEVPIQVTNGVESHKHVAQISVLPFRKSASGEVQRLKSFTLKTEENKLALRTDTVGARKYANASALSFGSNWYRIAVLKDGIYGIDQAFLKSLGVDLANLDPRKIRMYGFGGGQLPAKNGIERPDDLPEMAIEVTGEADGKFDASDKVIFYGKSQLKWDYNANTKAFSHTTNQYSDTTYYFLNTDIGIGKRVQKSQQAGNSNVTVNSFDDYAVHEKDEVNLIKSGNEWFGEKFDYQTNLSFPFSFPNLVSSEPVQYRLYALSKFSTGTSGFTLQLGNAKVNETILKDPLIGSYAPYALKTSMTGLFYATSSDIGLILNYSRTSPSSVGWLDYIELNARRKLTYVSGSLLFRDSKSVAQGAVANFVIENASGVRVWELSDSQNPRSVEYSVDGSNVSFTAKAESIVEYAACKPNNELTPIAAGKVENQNLHGIKQADMIIAAYPMFMKEAEELAEFHRKRDGMSVVVANVRKIYNEFSSGSPDILAIRSFCKMLYDRNTDSVNTLKYLLLFGDGSYDNKQRIKDNSNFIPSYQSLESLDGINSYTSDDYYALLDDEEGEWFNGELLDIGVGRFPVRNNTEAASVVKKIKHYAENSDCFGDWRNVLCYLADDEDGSLFVDDSEELVRKINKPEYAAYNIEKIYIDAYKQEVVTGGQRYPEVKDALNNRVRRGALIINYVGHGGETGWALERILEVADIQSWSNYNKLPMFMTATCEFSRFDDPERTSAGELVLLNPNGGGIAMFTTVRLVYASSNKALALRFYEHALPKGDFIPTLGHIYKMSKNAMIGDYNTRNFTLLGDPALKLSYPVNRARITSVNLKAANDSSVADTLKAMSKVTIGGIIEDARGNKLSSFNGSMYPTIYDKAATFNTLSNDQNGSPRRIFSLQKNILYKGKVSVKNGEFNATFIVPKDIAYNFGKGRMSLYANNETTDATGNFDNVIIGGVNPNAPDDNEGPAIRLFMNSENFANGASTSANPMLLATLADSSGINTVGNGIGHDLMATLDNDKQKTFILNEYYEADLNSYQKGSARYQLSKLPVGKHVLHLKAWDVYNNSSEKELDFIVVDNAKLALEHLFNYPNPFTTSTDFYFNHNKPGVPMKVQVQIYTISGKMIKSINTTVTSDSYISDPIHWDGLDEYGDHIGKGVYIYRLKVITPDGTATDKLEKLVVLK